MFSYLDLVVPCITLLLGLRFWLNYCSTVDERHKDNPLHARNIIAATGRNFPLGWRARTAVLRPTRVSNLEDTSGRALPTAGEDGETGGKAPHTLDACRAPETQCGKR